MATVKHLLGSIGLIIWIKTHVIIWINLIKNSSHATGVARALGQRYPVAYGPQKRLSDMKKPI